MPEELGFGSPDSIRPLARDAGSIAQEQVVGGDYVLFDSHRLRYHTLKPLAMEIYQLCDGRRTEADIWSELGSRGFDLPIELVQHHLLELFDAELVAMPAQAVGDLHSRRAAIRLVAAAFAGGLLLPAVSSISAPVGAETSGECLAWGANGPPCSTLGRCADTACTDFCRTNNLGNCAHCDNANLSEGGCCNCYNGGSSPCPCF